MKVKYGQNFLKDKYTYIFVNAVIKYIPTRSLIIEVGPGRGNITRCIDKKYSIVAYEIDPIFYTYLTGISVIWKDFLQNNINSRYFIGNLPFYCSKDILINIITKPGFILGVFIVGDYFISKYKSILSRYEVIRYCKIPGSSFYPSCKFNADILVIKRN